MTITSPKNPASASAVRATLDRAVIGPVSEVQTCRSCQRRGILTGRVITMSAGSRWFHPDNGDAPMREA